MDSPLTTAGNDRVCVFDPLTALMAHYSDAAEVSAKAKREEPKTVEEQLKARIIDGNKTGIERFLAKAMRVWCGLHNH